MRRCLQERENCAVVLREAEAVNKALTASASRSGLLNKPLALVTWWGRVNIGKDVMGCASVCH